MRKLKIAICYEPPAKDSPADLQDILSQAEFLLEHLCAAGYDAYHLPFYGVAEFLDGLAAADMAWNLFETFGGREDAQYMGAALLELAGKPYTGMKLRPLVMASDKRLIKKLLGGAVPMPETYEAGGFTPGMWIIKPAALHGSAGITDASVFEAFSEDVLVSALDSGDVELFAERYIDGDEFSSTLLDKGAGLVAVAVARMEFIDFPEGKPKILGFDAKWDESSSDYGKTVRSFDVRGDISARIKELSMRASRIMGLEGFARLDFRLDSDGGLWLIDVNPNPGLGESSGFMAACGHVGLDIGRTLMHIIESAMRKVWK